MKRFFVIIFSILAFCSVSAQNTADIGIWGGIGSYTGDMTHVNYSSSLSPNLGLFVRYNFNSRVSLRTSIMAGNIKAVGEYETNPWEFSKFVTDFSFMGEFNFFRYIIGSSRYSLTTYLLGGVGASLYNYTYDYNKLRPVVYYLNPSQLASVPSSVRDNELVLAPEDGIKTETTIGLNIPLGFGVKFNIGERWGIGFEGILRKYFNDKIDDLDDPRKFFTKTGTNSSGDPIGYWNGYNDALHNNDYSLHLGIHLTYRFLRGNRECPVYENIN